MAKNRSLAHAQSHPAAAMSPSHSYTVDFAAGSHGLDDDNDICPVCDGECTCAKDNQTVLPAASVSSSSSLLPTAQTPSRASQKPTSLKIKLTVPPNLKYSPKKSKNSEEMTSVDDSAGGSSSALPVYHPLLDPNAPKRRGRPSKAVVAAREAAARSAAETHAANHQQKLPYTAFLPPNVKQTLKSGGVSKSRVNTTKRKTTTGKKPAPPRRHSRKSQSSTIPRVHRTKQLVEEDESAQFDDDLDDNSSTQFPTFVSAYSSSGSESDASDSSSSSGFESDSSMFAEEEKYLISEEHMAQSKARVRRELLGDEGSRKQHRKSWIIRPRKQSVGPGELDMDVDSDATEDEDEDDELEMDEDEEDETDGHLDGRGYLGLVTGWSDDEDEESSFDAELFFASLTDSEKGGSSSGSIVEDDGGDDGDDGDQSDLDSMSVDEPVARRRTPALEVTQGLDGQIMFTNGLHDDRLLGHHMDFDMEPETPVEASPSPSQASGPQESVISETFEDDDEEGYMQDLDEDLGNTTDEDLIGADNRPNEHAMRLFQFPSSVSAINPLSTMSPGVSPSSKTRRLTSSLESPKPSDILEGRVFWDSDDEVEDGVLRSYRSMSRSSKGDGGPRRGTFKLVPASPHTVVTTSRKGVPSPHPRLRGGRRGRGRGSSASSLRHDELDQFLRRTLFPARPSSVPAPDRSSSSFIHTPSNSQSSIITGGEPNSVLAPAIELDDVLDSSFLDDNEPSSSSSAAVDGGKHIKSLNRWDRISIGAFRQSRDEPAATAGWGSDTGVGACASGSDLGGVMKSGGPLSTMLWQNKSGGATDKPAQNLSVLVSPVLFPVHERDGDRTPTNVTSGLAHAPVTPTNTATPGATKSYSCTPSSSPPNAKKREQRRERKLRKQNSSSSAASSRHNKDANYVKPKRSPQQKHQRGHYPNMKSRSASASQRPGFGHASSGGGIPPLSL